MAGSPTVLSEIDAFTEGRRGRMRPWKWLVVPAALLGVLVLFVPTVVGSVPWAPVLHWNCTRGAMVDSRTYYAPGVFANSPYRGFVWANSSTTHLSYAGEDGAAGGVFVPLLFQLFHARNVTADGPGANHRCGARYLAGTSSFTGNAAATVPFTTLVAGTPTDVGETAPAIVPGSSYPVVAFDPAFRDADLPPIATCQTGAASVTVSAPRFVVEATFYVDDRAVTVPVPVDEQLHLHYWFPPGTGTWNVQSLANGPAGFAAGWAFTYANCPAPTAQYRLR